MKKQPEPQEPSDSKTASPAPDPPQDANDRGARSGEGAHSAMKQWLHEMRDRLNRPEH
jgi:hypothetical protein